MKQIRALLLAQLVKELKQGTSAEGLALSLTAGVVVGLFPIFGATTALGLAVGALFRLNQPILQAVNYLMAPLQLLMIPVFLLAGEKICGAPPLSLNPSVLVQEFWADIPRFFAHYGMAGLHGMLAWLLAAAPLGALVYFPARMVFRRWRRKEDLSS